MWGNIMISMYSYDNKAYVDYMDLGVCCPSKAVQFNHSLITNFMMTIR